MPKAPFSHHALTATEGQGACITGACPEYVAFCGCRWKWQCQQRGFSWLPEVCQAWGSLSRSYLQPPGHWPGCTISSHSAAASLLPQAALGASRPRMFSYDSQPRLSSQSLFLHLAAHYWQHEAKYLNVSENRPAWGSACNAERS